MNQALSLKYINTEISKYYGKADSPFCRKAADSILLNKSQETVSKLLSNCVNAAMHRFKRGISFFHLTALTGNEAALDVLCAQKLQSMPLDDKLYSPSHLRAMTSSSKTLSSDSWLKKFKTKCLVGKDKNDKKNAHGATPYDLFDLAHVPPKPAYATMSNRQKAAFNETHFVEVSPNVLATENCLSEAFQFVNRIYMNSKALFDQWLHSEIDMAENTISVESCSAIQNLSPPKLLIKQSPQMGCGLFAREAISAGQFVAEYFGEMRSYSSHKNYLASKHSAYTMDSLTSKDKYIFELDADKFRSAAAFANDGLPNAVTKQCRDGKGVARRVFFESLGIKSGEEIKIDYGPIDNCKREKHVISDEEMKEIERIFFTQKDPAFENLFLNILESDEYKNIKHLPIKLILRSIYIIASPQILFKLATGAQEEKSNLFKNKVRHLIFLPGFDAIENVIEKLVPTGIANLVIACKVSDAFHEIALHQGRKAFFDDIMEIVYNQGSNYFVHDDETDNIEPQFVGGQYGRALYMNALVSSFNNLIKGAKQGLSESDLMVQFLEDLTSRDQTTHISVADKLAYAKDPKILKPVMDELIKLKLDL